MSKMTRDERLAAGWVECWGRYGWNSKRWWCGEPTPGDGYWGAPGKRPRHAWPSLEAALAGLSHGNNEDVTPRRFWRRRKPKAPPPLKVGDEVMVRAKVTHVELEGYAGNLDVCVRPGVSHKDIWISAKDIVR